MTLPPNILLIALAFVGMIVISGVGIVVTTIIKNFVTAQQKRLTESFGRIHEISKKQSECSLALKHLDLPKLAERVQDHEYAFRGYNDLETLVKRVEENSEILSRTVIQFTEKVNNIGEKLEITLRNQEEHFATVENAFSAKVAEVMQSHLSAFREEQRSKFSTIFRKFDEHEKRMQKIELEIERIRNTKTPKNEHQ